MSLTEEDIEDYLEAYPYLIDPIFSNEKYLVLRQYTIENNRIDLLIQNDSIKIITIIEIKKSKLQKVHYHQIIRYYDIIKLKFPDYFVNGFLIGHKNSRESNLNKSEWLSIKYLDEDIPSKIKICKSCRKPISYISYECNFCFQRF
jgi:RecB family endonuclease NucS